MLAVMSSPKDEPDAEMWWEDHEHVLAAGIDLAADSAAEEQQVEVGCYDVHSCRRPDVALQFLGQAEMAYAGCKSATQLSMCLS